MNLVVTGGGTGGHIYPALEIAKAARREGADVVYLGSFRGQESAICEREKFPFQGFPSEPLYSPRELRGWKSAVALLKATQQAKAYLRRKRPDAVFSTGGYSAAPVMAAAKSQKIPYVIHESNSVPGRSNRMFAAAASSFTCVFEKTLSVIPNAVRTGQPIRAELRRASEIERPHPGGLSRVLTVGGSQGSAFLNDIVSKAADQATTDFQWLLVVGRGNYDAFSSKARPPQFQVFPYLDADELSKAYREVDVVVARSGGTVAELAMFGIPSVLIPLPTAADDHQTKNAEEFVQMEGATLLRQADATPENLRSAIEGWLSDEARYNRARIALKQWDRPDATESILKLVLFAANS